MASEEIPGLALARAVIGYGASLIVFVVLEAFWLGALSGDFYTRELGAILRPDPAIGPALIFFFAYPAGLTIFAVMPATRVRRASAALGLGALFGLFAYGAYALTALAVIQGWTWRVAITDMAWGVVVSGVTAFLGYQATRMFGTGRVGSS